MADGKLDLNQATADDLAALPGIGKALAARIVAHRQEVQRFEEVAELAAVRGVSDDMAAALAEHLVVAKQADKGEKAVKADNGAKGDGKPAASARPPASDLRQAARTGDAKRVQALLNEGADPTDRFAFIWAAQDGHEAVVQLLITAGADVNCEAGGGTNPLALAAQNGHLGVVKTLVAAGADVDAPGIGGWTPLMKAAFFGHEAVVQALLAAGADRHARNERGESAGRLAQQADSPAILALL